MKVREVIKRLEGMVGGWFELKAAIDSTIIRRSRVRLLSRDIRQWTFRPER
jgi:hypothetical protein